MDVGKTKHTRASSVIHHARSRLASIHLRTKAQSTGVFLFLPILLTQTHPQYTPTTASMGASSSSPSSSAGGPNSSRGQGDEARPPPNPSPSTSPASFPGHSMPSFGLLGLSAVGILGCGMMAGVYRAKHNETTAEEWRRLPPAQQAKHWKRSVGVQYSSSSTSPPPPHRPLHPTHTRTFIPTETPRGISTPRGSPARLWPWARCCA